MELNGANGPVYNLHLCMYVINKKEVNKVNDLEYLEFIVGVFTKYNDNDDDNDSNDDWNPWEEMGSLLDKIC